MAGYIGSKAVNLSTTGADINGDANIDGDLSFRDNDKAIFGAGSDLSIYHDGVHSRLKETGTGGFYFDVSNSLFIRRNDTSALMASFETGTAKLYYDNSLKLATTSTGIDVTGTVTADSLTVDGSNATAFLDAATGTSYPTLQIGGSGTPQFSIDADLAAPTTNGTLIRTRGGAYPLRFGTNTTERMRIDSSGNVGIGTSSPNKPLTVFTSAATDSARFTDNTNSELFIKHSAGNLLTLATGSTSQPMAFGQGSTERMRIDSSGVVRIGGQTGTLKLGNDGTYHADIEWEYNNNELAFTANNTANFTFNSNGSERMRIDSSGNVGIGITSPTHRLDVLNDGGEQLRLLAWDQSASARANIDFWYLDSGGTSYNNAQISTLAAANAGNGNLVFSTRPTSGSLTEAMRIDSSGNLLVGTTSSLFSGSHKLEIYTTNASGDSGIVIKHRDATGVTNVNAQLFVNNAGSAVGSIQMNSSSTSYNTSSDHRLKENVAKLTGATTRLKQLEPKRFNFIADADTTVDGFLAHEVQTVVPEAISGTHNEVDAEGNPVYQGIDQSKLVPLLVATIQELEARITALENA